MSGPRTITNLFDEYALGVFRQYTDERLVELHRMFTRNSQEQKERDPNLANGSQALAELVLQVQRERVA